MTWGTPTDDFWCCHGTLVQAHTSHTRDIYFANDEGLVLCQYIPSRLAWQYDGVAVTVTLESKGTSVYALSPQSRQGRSAQQLDYTLDINCSHPTELALKIRLPWWLSAVPSIEINGERESVPFAPSSFYTIRQTWHNDRLTISLPKALSSVPLPDAPDMVAFMDGPIVLAGLCNDAPTLYGSKDRPDTILAPYNERQWGQWVPGG